MWTIQDVYLRGAGLTPLSDFFGQLDLSTDGPGDAVQLLVKTQFGSGSVAQVDMAAQYHFEDHQL